MFPLSHTHDDEQITRLEILLEQLRQQPDLDADLRARIDAELERLSVARRVLARHLAPRS